MTRIYRVTGRVQGVFFRASTRDAAVRLGMQGHAVNRDDGSVEVLAVGSASAHQELEAWLRAGPSGAEVASVSFETANVSPPPGFSIG